MSMSRRSVVRVALALGWVLACLGPALSPAAARGATPAEVDRAIKTAVDHLYRTQGPDGLKAVSQHAVLNANYIMALVKHVYPVPHGDRCMHEFVASAEPLKRRAGVTAMDLAKGLLDRGFHAPTVYFPLTVPEAMMMEPTETESKETLDGFVDALRALAAAAREQAHQWPASTQVSRPDEVKAARQPVTRWTPTSG